MGKVYGYCRISTKQQNIERQTRNIKAAYPNAYIVEEVYTGTKTEGREHWNNLQKIVAAGDIIIFDSVSRMSRDAEEGFAAYEDLYQRGVDLVFLKEPHINTETYKQALAQGVPTTGTMVDYILDGINKYLMALAKEQIRLSFEQAEKEVTDLRQRTKEGLLTAKLNGKRVGLPKGTVLETKKEKKSKKLIFQYAKDFNGTLSDADTMKIIGISRNAYYKYKRAIKRELGFPLSGRAEKTEEKSFENL